MNCNTTHYRANSSSVPGDPTFQTDERRARGTRPQLPRLRTVLVEQVRVTGHALRGVALIAAALLALVTLFAASQVATRGAELTLNAWPTQMPGIIGALLPIAVWARDERFGPSFLWTLPVDRRRLALTKVLAGWVWLMGAVALFVVWVFVLSLASGGRALPPETLHLIDPQVTALRSLDPALLRTARWSPGALLWAVPFTAATACYLLSSALVLGSRYRLRWVIGTVVAYTLLSFASNTAGTRLDVSWLSDAPARGVRLIIDSRYGLDAVLTARIETLSEPATLATGEEIDVWAAVPKLSDWGTATLLWTVAGLLAVWAAASRHREQRRG